MRLVDGSSSAALFDRLPANGTWHTAWGLLSLAALLQSRWQRCVKTRHRKAAGGLDGGYVPVSAYGEILQLMKVLKQTSVSLALQPVLEKSWEREETGGWWCRVSGRHPCLIMLGQRLVKTGLHYDTEQRRKGHGRGVLSPKMPRLHRTRAHLCPAVTHRGRGHGAVALLQTARLLEITGLQRNFLLTVGKLCGKL